MECNESDAEHYSPRIAFPGEEGAPSARNRSVFAPCATVQESQDSTVRPEEQSCEYGQSTPTTRTRRGNSAATEQHTLTMEVSLPRSEKLAREGISTFSGGRVAHYFCQCQELRTDLEPGAVGGIGIDEETDAVILESELDCPSGRSKIICFSDYQNAFAAKLDQDFRQMAALGSRDELDLAADDIRRPLHSRDTNRMLRGEPSSLHIIKSGANWIRPKNAYRERILGVREGVRRPVHEFGEI